jgi:hypothetical protein
MRPPSLSTLEHITPPVPLKLLSDKHSPIESAYAIMGHMTPTNTAKAAPNCREDGHIYGWTRFWVPETGTINLSDGGFLLDPTDLVLRSHVSGPAPLADLTSYRALALLGEPGIGKSTALKAEVERVAAQPAETNAVSIYVDLRDYSSDVLLYQKVFESAKFTAWKNGTSHLFLHLDSLDEALLRVETIANLLTSELPHYPTARMSVRIVAAAGPGALSCRPRGPPDPFGPPRASCRHGKPFTPCLPCRIRRTPIRNRPLSSQSFG